MAKSSNNKTQKQLPLRRIATVVLIGCGGTGAIVAEHLCRMIKGYRLDVQLMLYDGDTVEAANVTRQNFYPHEIGASKSKALALRLAGQFGLEVAAYDGYFTKTTPIDTMMATLHITCTDTLSSRRIVADRSPSYWLDVGNDKHHGQAVIGTTHEPSQLRGAFWNFNKKPHALDLPDIAAINPAILKARRTRTKAGCAQMPFAQQGFGVNAMAALAAATIAKQVLVDRKVSFAGIYFDISKGRMAPQMITQDLFGPWKQKPKAENDK